MRYYFGIVYEALNQEVAPFLRETIEPALSAKYGNDWYNSYGLSIMNHYAHVEDIEEGMSKGLTPLMSMDITALCFFLFPYGEDEIGNGAIDVLVEYYKWDEWQFRKIERIRRIRNRISHEKYEKNFVLSNENIVNGIQEKAWLSELEEIVKRLKPSFNLAKYHVDLEKKVAEKLKDEGNVKISMFTKNGEAARNAYTKIHKFNCSEAPIGAPLTREAPWTKSNADLLNLPWPSAAVEQKQVNAGKRSDDRIQDTVNKAFNQVEKGVNKLFDMFKR